ncbi:four helix bundle protein [Terrimonas ginsenosidimutans]|uniref:four helix bundle protein n=1 Tax=Terrimonas ginsenosidimutans TaxID=2908004 RepID=UPI003D7992C8
MRSATSIGANVIEGKAGTSRKDWRNFFSIALKSANETIYWLCLIRDTIDLIDKEVIESLIKEADEISKIIARIIISSRL